MGCLTKRSQNGSKGKPVNRAGVLLAKEANEPKGAEGVNNNTGVDYKPEASEPSDPVVRRNLHRKKDVPAAEDLLGGIYSN